MKKKKNLKWAIGGVVILGAIIVGAFLELKSSTVYFRTPEEVLKESAALEGEYIRVGAMVTPGTIVRKPELPLVTFAMSDMKGNSINVRYKGIPPDMFKESQGVVVEGRMEHDQKTMIARKLMVKHSEEYKPPHEGNSIDKELLEKSIFKK